MKKEVPIFFTALMFFTRIPVPKNINHNHDMLQKSARYFSWVGLLMGGIGAFVFFFSSTLFSPALAIACSMLATILATGAFHEDGFADCCDAFGGGWTKEKILLIMKDSRLGTYGVVGLMGVLGFKFLILLELSGYTSVTAICCVMIAAHSTSRLMAVCIMQQYPYVQDMDLSKSKPLANRKLTAAELGIAVTGSILSLLLLQPILWLAIVPVYLVQWLTGRYFKKWIGGYTGDCLGATQQVCEVILYLSILLISRHL
ncbi:MAG: adenosylcobinamide-GDP ribazoletransferase [Sediminibacterium sp.]